MPRLAPGGILLAVGVEGAEPIRALLEAAGPAAGVVVKQPAVIIGPKNSSRWVSPALNLLRRIRIH